MTVFLAQDAWPAVLYLNCLISNGKKEQNKTKHKWVQKEKINNNNIKNLQLNNYTKEFH